MTKFPEGATAPDLQLKKVIASVEAGTLASGYVPRIALEKPPFHPNLWDNVELYLLGSSRGIAILEKQVQAGAQPQRRHGVGLDARHGPTNSAARREEFGYRRADWGGLIESVFEWDDPEATVKKAVKDWLSGASGNGN